MTGEEFEQLRAHYAAAEAGKRFSRREAEEFVRLAELAREDKPSDLGTLGFLFVAYFVREWRRSKPPYPSRNPVIS